MIELAIRDLKEGAGLCHCPSGRFFANAAWLVLCGLAHNLLRWVAALGLGIPGPIVAKTVRRRYLTLRGVSPARRADAGCAFLSLAPTLDLFASVGPPPGRGGGLSGPRCTT